MPFEYLEDIATADVAFHAWGSTLEEMFLSASDATMNVMVGDLDTIAETEQRTLEAETDAVDMLLFDLLQELIYYKDAEQLLLRVREVRITKDGDRFNLKGEAYGELLDPAKHDLIVDVKAVTLHRFQVEETYHGWEATVILDI